MPDVSLMPDRGESMYALAALGVAVLDDNLEWPGVRSRRHLYRVGDSRRSSSSTLALQR